MFPQLKGSRFPRVRRILLAAGAASIVAGVLRLHGAHTVLGVVITLFAYIDSAWMTDDEGKAEAKALEERRVNILLDAYAQHRVTRKHRWLKTWLRLTMDPAHYQQLSQRLDHSPPPTLQQ